MLLALIKGEGRRGVIIFTRTRRRAGWVATALRRNDLPVGLVHGNRSQVQRQRAIERFSAGDVAVLVATDVAARGLHIPAIRTVINYDLPIRTEEYVTVWVARGTAVVSGRRSRSFLRARRTAGRSSAQLQALP